MMSKYIKIKEKLDLEHKIPKEDSFIGRDFKKIRWSNVRDRNIFIIIKMAAENGWCTINDIVDNDGFEQTTKNRKKRHGNYNLQIKGRLGKFQGLIDKGIIEEEDNWEIKRKKRYRLSVFGVLYAIHLFSKDVQYTKYDYQITYKIKSTTKYKKNILDVLVENYSDLVPLIFGNWEFMVSEFGARVNFLVELAHIKKATKIFLQTEPLINSDVVHMKGWEITNNKPASELSILLFAYIARQETEFPIKFGKDRKILDLYKRYIKFLKKKQYHEAIRIKYQEAILNMDEIKIEKLGIELRKFA